jgi:ABC-type Fe3+-hydroxamate transport system substrate-binding protein
MERIFKDQMNRAVRLEGIPRRIVSLVPSQTELLYDLGLQDEVVGITKFCIYPDEWYRKKQRVGGTKQLNIATIGALNPDFIIGNKEENTKEDIQALEAIAPVWMSDIYTFDDALQMIEQVGELVGKNEAAEELVIDIQHNFELIDLPSKSTSFLYFIWKDPDFIVGQHTFIDSLLSKIGFDNLCKENRYPQWKETEIQPDCVFLSSEPYPFTEEHIILYQERFPNSKIRVINGEMCSWYGSRIKLAPAYFNNFMNELDL